MKKPKVTLDPPRSPSLWPEPKITEKSEAKTILAGVRDYLERATEALGCVESRLGHKNLTTGILTQKQAISVSAIRRSVGEALGILKGLRKEADSIIAEGIAKKEESGLF